VILLLLKDISLLARLNTWMHHDGAVSHFGQQVTGYLSKCCEIIAFVMEVSMPGLTPHVMSVSCMHTDKVHKNEYLIGMP